MMLNSKSIGNKIAAARKKVNLSQAELAQQVAISSQAVGKWERGESMPDISMLNRLAGLLGVDLNYFSESFPSSDPGPGSPEVLTEKPAAAESARSDKRLSWDMSQGNWENADFSGLRNLQEKFSSSNMKNCKFTGSELSGLLLRNNNVDGCDFSGSDISGSQFQRSNLGGNAFKDCRLNGAEFSECNIQTCDFTSADLTGTTFHRCNFNKNILTDALWGDTSFIEMNLDEVVFNGTLKDCKFENCDFYRVTFQNVTLINNFFKSRKYMKRIRFVDCKADRMTYEFLKNGRADVSGITLIS